MLELKNISVQLPQFSLKNISFRVEKGDYTILAGPSGAGKTMLLETLAGFRKLESGEILYMGVDISGKPADKRPLSLLFQDLALFPHLSVAENIGYAISDKRRKKQRIKEIAHQMNVEKHLGKAVHKTSGGEKQRIALARALAAEPDILLLDEPLSSLDRLLKSELMQLLYQINQQGQTIIHVTHDAKEAFELADKAGILKEGRLERFDVANKILEKPGDRFTAAFLGFDNILASEKTATDTKGADYMAFRSLDISFQQIDNSMAFSGNIIHRASGCHWLETSAGLIKLPEIGAEPLTESRVFVPLDKICWLKD